MVRRVAKLFPLLSELRPDDVVDESSHRPQIRPVQRTSVFVSETGVDGAVVVLGLLGGGRLVCLANVDGQEGKRLATVCDERTYGHGSLLLYAED